jgi:signal transduction histidine kinase
VPGPLRVLLIEDNEDDAALTVRTLKRAGLEPDWRRVDTEPGLREALTTSDWDLVLCDYTMPQLDAPSAFRIVQERGRDVPFIIVSGTIGEEAAVEAMHLGVHDFVLKGNTVRLVPAIERELTEARMRQQLRASEEMLRRTERLRSLGEMAAGISHDIKNILNPAGLQLTRLERAIGRNDLSIVKDATTALRQVLARGVETVERLRAFSRQEPDVPLQPVNLDALAAEAVELVRPRMSSGDRTPSHIVVTSGAPPPINGVEADLVSAVVNLVANAIDAMPRGGTITVSTGCDGRGPWLEVADDGPGMTPEVRKRVFEPFYTTKGDAGTGLGLAMVYSCMVRHGGTVELESSPGHGARFKLRFPALAPAAR